MSLIESGQAESPVLEARTSQLSYPGLADSAIVALLSESRPSVAFHPAKNSLSKTEAV